LRTLFLQNVKGLETGNRTTTIHVVRAGDIVYVFESPLDGGHHEINDHLAKHGDGVRDVAFTCDDAAGIYQKAIERGATGVRAPETLKDEHGTVIIASVKTYGDTIHTFV
jgi:4-hydroxyphenylpyruvate dioxygenase